MAVHIQCWELLKGMRHLFFGYEATNIQKGFFKNKLTIFSAEATSASASFHAGPLSWSN